MAQTKNIRSFSSVLRAGGFLFRGRRQMGQVVINKTGSDIAADSLVAISGFDVTTKLVKVVLADADSANLATDVYVTLGKITNGKAGNVYKGGLSAANLNTNGVTTVGDPVYLNTTAGGFTATAPTSNPSVVVLVGYTTVKSTSVGQIAWDIQPASKFGSGSIQSGVDASILTATGTITSANITGAAAGQLGHAQGVVLVAAGGVGVYNQLVYAVWESLFLTAAYTDGGNLSVNNGAGGTAITGVAANTVWCTNAATAYGELDPLTAANRVVVLNNPLNLVSTVAPTQPGTAAGTLKWIIGYRAITA